MTHVHVRLPFRREFRKCQYFFVTYLNPASSSGFLIEERFDWVENHFEVIP